MGLTKEDTRSLGYRPYEPEPAQNPTFLQLGFRWLRFRVCGRIYPELGMLSIPLRGTLLGTLLKSKHKSLHIGGSRYVPRVFEYANDRALGADYLCLNSLWYPKPLFCHFEWLRLPFLMVVQQALDYIREAQTRDCSDHEYQ